MVASGYRNETLNRTMASIYQESISQKGTMQDHQVLSRWFERRRRECRQLVAVYRNIGAILRHFSYHFSCIVSDKQLCMESDMDFPRQIRGHSILRNRQPLAQVSVFYGAGSRSILGHPDTVDGGFRSVLHLFCSLCNCSSSTCEFPGQHPVGVEDSSGKISVRHL